MASSYESGSVDTSLDPASYGGTVEGAKEGGAKIAQGGKLAQIGNLVTSAVPGMAPSLPWLHIATIPEKYRTDIAIKAHIDKENEEKDAYGLAAIYKSIEDDKTRMAELGGNMDEIRQKQAALMRPEIPTDFKPSVGGGIAALLTGAKTGDFETALGNLKKETDQNQALEYQNSMNKFADEGKNNGANLASLLKEYEITSNHKGDSEKNVADFNRTLMMQDELNKRTESNNDTKITVQEMKGESVLDKIKAGHKVKLEEIFAESDKEWQARNAAYLRTGYDEESAAALATDDTHAKYGKAIADTRLANAKALAIPKELDLKAKAIQQRTDATAALIKSREKIAEKGFANKLNIVKIMSNTRLTAQSRANDAALERLIMGKSMGLSKEEMDAINSEINALTREKSETLESIAKAKEKLAYEYDRLGEASDSAVKEGNRVTKEIEQQIKDKQEHLTNIAAKLADRRDTFKDVLTQTRKTVAETVTGVKKKAVDNSGGDDFPSFDASGNRLTSWNGRVDPRMGPLIDWVESVGFRVTSRHGDGHLEGSAHWDDRGLDISVKGKTESQITGMVNHMRDQGYFCIDEQPGANEKTTARHIHVSLPPEKKTLKRKK